jgi:hypothetical protein
MLSQVWLISSVKHCENDGIIGFFEVLKFFLKVDEVGEIDF